MNAIDLQKLSRTEIQQLAKKAGIKANETKQAMVKNLLKSYPSGVPRLVAPLPRNRQATQGVGKEECKKGVGKSSPTKTAGLSVRITRSQSRMLVNKKQVTQPAGHADSALKSALLSSFNTEPTQSRVRAASSTSDVQGTTQQSEIEEANTKVSPTVAKGKARAVDTTRRLVVDAIRHPPSAATTSSGDNSNVALPYDPWRPAPGCEPKPDPLSVLTFTARYPLLSYGDLEESQPQRVEEEQQQHHRVSPIPRAEPVERKAETRIQLPTEGEAVVPPQTEKACTGDCDPAEAQEEEDVAESLIPTAPSSPIIPRNLSSEFLSLYGNRWGGAQPRESYLVITASEDERFYERLRQAEAARREQMLTPQPQPRPEPHPEPTQPQQPKPAYVLEREIEFLTKQLAKREVELSELRQDLQKVETVLENVRQETAAEVKELRERCQRADERFQALLKMAGRAAIEAFKVDQEPLDCEMVSEAVEEEGEKAEESLNFNLEPGGNKWPASPKHYFSVASITSAAPMDDPDEQMEEAERARRVQTRSIQQGVAKMERETYAMGERLDELIFDATNYKLPIELQEVTKAVKERCELWETNVKLETDVGESDAKGASQGKETQIKETDFGGKERGVTTEDSAKSTDTSNRPVSASELQLR